MQVHIEKHGNIHVYMYIHIYIYMHLYLNMSNTLCIRKGTHLCKFLGITIYIV